MLNVQVSEEVQIAVRFRHDEIGTACEIFTGHPGDKVPAMTLISVGEARCNRQHDQPNKSVGRKLSLTRALENLESKPVRKMIWESYAKATDITYRPGKPRKKKPSIVQDQQVAS